MATNNKIWIALAVVTILFAAGYYFYDANTSTAEAQQVEQVQGEIPNDQENRRPGGERDKSKNPPAQVPPG